MPTLTITEIQELMLEDLAANVTTDKPITTGAASQALVQINDAYAQVWEIKGGSVIAATSATLWTPDVSADTTGKLTGDLTSVAEILHLWSTTTSGSTGGGAGDNELDRRDLSEIEFMRANSSSTTGCGTYAEPQIYAISVIATTTPASVNKWLLDVWPGVSGRYFPAHYIPQITPLDFTTVTTPDLNDIESRDVAHLAALAFAPLIDRSDLAPGIARKISDKTRLALERKREAAAEARQDR